MPVLETPMTTFQAFRPKPRPPPAAAAVETRLPGAITESRELESGHRLGSDRALPVRGRALSLRTDTLSRDLAPLRILSPRERHAPDRLVHGRARIDRVSRRRAAHRSLLARSRAPNGMMIPQKERVDLRSAPRQPGTTGKYLPINGLLTKPTAVRLGVRPSRRLTAHSRISATPRVKSSSTGTPSDATKPGARPPGSRRLRDTRSRPAPARR